MAEISKIIEIYNALDILTHHYESTEFGGIVRRKRDETHQQLQNMARGLVLTQRQHEVLKYIAHAIQQEGNVPSIRQAAQVLHLTASGVVYHFNGLEKKGYISQNVYRRHRSWQLTDRAKLYLTVF